MTAKIDKPVGLDAPSGDSDDELDGIACKGTRLCVAVDTLGNVVRFDPHSKSGGQLKSVDKGHALNAVACPSGTRCLLADSAGRILTGNPHSGGWTAATLPGAASLTDVTCRSTATCVAVDDAGNEFAARS